ncbi:MAG: peptidylprolyl isomerase [Sulfurospirillum sp.]|nr:peptidylprolyl isomerase [Sulfurospirillum sp.]
MKKQILSIVTASFLALSLNAAVFATVDEDEINDQDMQAILAQMPQLAQGGITPDVKKQIIDQAIDRKLLAKEAMKSGIEKDKAFQEALVEVKKNLALEVWMKKVYDNVVVSEADIKKYYDENKNKLVDPKQIKARHILLKTQEDAKAVIAELKGLSGKALNDKFIELAKAKSTGPSAPNGGDLGWFNERMMVPEFSQAAFALKDGAMTQTPVKTSFGHHVILKEESKGGGVVKYEEAKERIKNGLHMEKFRVSVSDKAQELRKTAKIIIK